MDTIETSTVPEMGPSSYENWQSQSKGNPKLTLSEFPFYTDAHVTGEQITQLGPYQLLNGLAFANPSVIFNNTPNTENIALRPAIVLRAEIYAVPIPELTTASESDDSHYHAGGPNDELAALISLCLGIRLRSGDESRRFDLAEDTLGRPVGHTPQQLPPVVRRFASSEAILPNAQGVHSLDSAAALSTLPQLSPQEAMTLVVAARNYQNAVWFAEAEPELSWLLFVSAIETAAEFWDRSSNSPKDKLKEAWPELFDLASTQGAQFASKVAKIVAPTLGATKKFAKFIKKFQPTSPPLPRPVPFAQLSWRKNDVEKAVRKIYDYRSRALHTGRPFPLPMCSPPHRFEEGYIETPLGLAASGLGGTWMKQDLPMLLHTFEYIVRHCLLNWWRFMVEPAPTEVPKDLRSPQIQ